MKKFSFEINGSKYEVNVKKVEGENAKIEVNGTPYNVKINQEVKVSKIRAKKYIKRFIHRSF